jgi:cellulose synthase/poly-beta-1,6-N-acetylglucosamine synthase-like glycosyltransferase
VEYAAVLIFWFCVVIIIYTYVGFPLLILTKSTLFPVSARSNSSFTPAVTFCIAAHNEEAVIAEKITNTFLQDYPQDKIEVIVGSDGSTDHTEQIVSKIKDPRLKLLSLPRQGKNLALNSIVEKATGSVLIFTDADSALEKDALAKIVAYLADPAVGGAAGNIHYEKGGLRNKGELLYWVMEHVQKKILGKGGSVTSATGQLYAIRKQLYQPIPRGVTDDFLISVQIVAAGRRLVFAPDAVARCPSAETTKSEYRRKVRVASGGLRGVWIARRLCNPFRYGFFAVQLFSHKVLRRLSVFPIALLLAINTLLVNTDPLFAFTMITQVSFHGLALVGCLLSRTPLARIKLFALPYFFDMTYIAVLAALAEILFGKKHDLWSVNRGTVAKVADIQ